MLPKKIPLLLRLSIIVMISMLAVGFGLDALIHHPPFQQYVLHRISTTVGYDIHAEEIRINLFKGVGVVADNASAKSSTGHQEFEASAIAVYFNVGELLNGNIVPTRLSVKSPIIKLASQKRGTSEGRIKTFFSSDFPLDRLARLDSVTLRDARIQIQGFPYNFQEVDLKLASRSKESPELEMNLHGRVSHGKTSGLFKIIGTLRPEVKTGHDPFVDVMLTVEDIPLKWIPQPNAVSFEEGYFQMAVGIKMPLTGPLQVTGEGIGRNIRFSIFRKEQEKKYSFPRLDMKLLGDYQDKVIRIRSSSIGNTEFNLNATTLLDFSNPSNPFLDLAITSPAMAISLFKTLFPTPFLSPWLGKRLFPVFTGGQVRLKRFALSGTMAEISNLGDVENAHALSLDLDLYEMTALENAGGLPIQTISGKLNIQDGRLTATGVTGKFGNSSIHKGVLDVPSLYVSPARLMIGLAGKFDLSDLMQQGRIDILPESVNSSIQPFTSMTGTMTSRIQMRFEEPHWGVEIMESDFQLKNCLITHNKWGFPLEINKAAIAFGPEGHGRYTGAGTWGKSVFQVSGAIESSGEGHRAATIATIDSSLKVTMDLTDLHILKKTDLLPVGFRNQINRLDTLVGKAIADVQIAYQAGWAYPKVTGGKIQFSQCHLSAPELMLPLNVDQANLIITGDAPIDLKATGRWGGSRFKASVKAAGGMNLASSEIMARIDGNAIPKEIIDRFFPRSRLPFRFLGPADVILNVKRKDQMWSFKGDVGLKNALIENTAFVMAPSKAGDKLLFDIGINEQKVIDFRKLTWRVGSATVVASGRYGADAPGKIPFRIAADSLLLKDLGFRMDPDHVLPDNSLIDGVVHGSVQGNLNLKAPREIQLVGYISVKKFFFGRNAPLSPILAEKLDLNFHGKNVDFEANGFTVGKNTLNVTAQFQDWPRLRGDITATAGELNLADATKQFPPADGGKKPDQPGKLFENSLVKLSLNANKILWKNKTYGPLSWVSTLQPGLLDIENIRVQIEQGTVEIRGRINSYPERDIFLLSHIKLEEKPIGEIIQALDIGTTKLEGKMSLNGALILKGSKREDLLPNLAGGFNIDITEGQIHNSLILLKVLEFLSLQKIFIKKPPDLSKEGLYFKSIEGYVNMNRGIITTDGLILKSPVLNAVIKGSMDSVTKQIDVDIGVQPLGTIDFIISNIPIIGHILTGKEKSLLIYYFKAKGSLDKPKVRFVPFKNLGKRTLDTFERILLTPGRLFKKISAIMKDLGEGNFGLPDGTRELGMGSEGR